MTLKSGITDRLATLVHQKRHPASPIQLTGKKSPIQTHPVILKDPKGHDYHVFVDVVAHEGARIVVLGWTTAPTFHLSLSMNGQDLASEIGRHARGDVADALGLPSGEGVGFSLVSTAPAVPDGSLDLAITVPQVAPYRTGALAQSSGLTGTQRGLVPELFEDHLATLLACEMGSAAWWTALAELPDATTAPLGIGGMIDSLLVSPAGNGLVRGWALHPADAVVWLEDERQNVYPLDHAFRHARADIAQTFKHVLWGGMDAAFIALLPVMSKAPRVKLRAASKAGVVTIAERGGAETLSATPRGAAEKLFEIETPERLFHERVKLIDWPVLEPLIKRYHAELEGLVPETRVFGTPLDSPEVSVIVPLYKRFDFMEHQILEFIRDPYFKSNAELIYVVDDPEIWAATLAESDTLFQLYKFPFKIVRGMRNRGFSGANNLGAAHARGKCLLFLNSDVIAQRPGWLEQMRDVLDDEKVGAVGAQLLFPDGGIQHLGMDFEYLTEFSIWSNQHPGAGMPATTSDHAPFEVPAITGACLLIRATLFDEISGWDTGYLLGDFEDSHLCFAIRSAGYRIMCQPRAVLTHLERQSFVSIGAGVFRIRMTICNAVRHQSLWSAFLQPDTEQHGSDVPVAEDIAP